MNLAEFLDRIIAPGNWLAVAYKGDWPGLSHRFYKRDDVKAAAGFLYWAADKRHWDTWFALASFKDAEPNQQGNKFVGPRTQDNADKLKTFWVDADIRRPGDGKDPAKVFVDEQDVIQWVKGFVSVTGIPIPNIWVKSGYGLHLYWTYKDALDKSQWQPYAEALKSALTAHGFRGDINVVADCARILRPIETWNYKVPAQPASCYEFYPGRLTASDYPNNIVLDTLARLPQYNKLPVLGTPPRPATPGSGSLAAARAGLSSAPRDFAQISMSCAQVGNSLAAGGIGDSRGLWWQLITLTTFCTDGQDWAHKVSEQDPRYTQAETDTEYARAVADRARKGIGAPLCKTLDAERPGMCQACPHYQSAAVTSPWHLGLLTRSSADPDELPDGFQWSGSWIERSILDRNNKTQWVRVFEGGVTNLRIDDIGGPLRLTMDYMSPGNTKHIVAIRNDEFDERTTKAVLARQGINVFPSRVRHACALIMAWIDKLRQAMRVRSEPAPSFGWYRSKYTNNTYLGFATGGTCCLAGGGEETVRGADPVILGSYEPVGSLAGWQKVAAFVAADVPELHTAIAASFGAPLMEFTGEAAGTISFVGKTAIGKSSAFKVGATVWGRWLSTMLQLHDTPTYKNLMTSTVRSLPVYWDEVRIRDPDQLIEELHILTQGRDKGRGTATVQVRTPGEWSTLSVLSSNNSLCDLIADKLGYNDPTFLRMLEVEIARDKVTYDVNAGPLVQTLDWNYGVVGQQYARYIADNVPLIQAAIKRERSRIAMQVAALDNEERFYLAITSAVLVGAAVAKKIGIIDLDRAGIEKVLCDAVIKARQVRHGYTPPTVGARLGKLLDDFLRDYGQQMVVTQSMAGPGPRARSGTQQPFLLHGPPGPMRDGSLAYQISVGDRLLRISRDHWRDWCRKKSLSPNGTRDEMAALWGLRFDANCRGPIGAGTVYRTTRTWYYEVSLAQPDLVSHLDPYVSTTGSGGGAAGNIIPIPVRP